jgi:hypothetical protein
MNGAMAQLPERFAAYTSAHESKLMFRTNLVIQAPARE